MISVNPSPADPCPCGRHNARRQPLPFSACCGPLLADRTAHPASSAEALMRSRYTAFVCGDVAYLQASWHPSTRPAELTLEPGVKWLGLEVRQHRALDTDHAEVEFVARSRIGGQGQRLHERSRFVREAGQWYYVDGDLL